MTTLFIPHTYYIVFGDYRGFHICSMVYHRLPRVQSLILHIPRPKSAETGSQESAGNIKYHVFLRAEQVSDPKLP